MKKQVADSKLVPPHSHNSCLVAVALIRPAERRRRKRRGGDGRSVEDRIGGGGGWDRGGVGGGGRTYGYDQSELPSRFLPNIDDGANLPPPLSYDELLAAAEGGAGGAGGGGDPGSPGGRYNDGSGGAPQQQQQQQKGAPGGKSPHQELTELLSRVVAAEEAASRSHFSPSRADPTRESIAAAVAVETRAGGSDRGFSPEIQVRCVYGVCVCCT